MAKITLKLDADYSAVSTALKAIKDEAKKLQGQKIDLGINTAQARAIADAARALAQLQKAQNEAKKSADNVAVAESKVAVAEAKAAAETAKYGAQIEKTRQAQEKTTQSANKLATEQQKTAQAQERTAQSANNLAAAEERTAQAEEKTKQAATRLAIEQEKTARSFESGADSANAFSVALGNIAARAFHIAISKITQAVKEALTEMKNVDTELINISKVSGITGKELSDIGDRAYETASKYGVAADEYLSAVYTFQKAGLGDSAEAMGELAVKTMLVGDTSADVASKFLISANAAWKLGGDMERLSQIVDEADYINNNYATDLEKLSSGLPRVASVAAQAGMSAEETLAAIGTITAVTQETGTKSATALRALILNIEGQIGEFMDETGETFQVTEESVKSMHGLMEKYAKAELDAAKAAGELINPMTAIKAIFEGMANSDLNDQELFSLLSGMGGKLRTNQLTALVQNYEMFNEMLEAIAGSAGTADKEISLMMDSWERKTQVLKNTWAEFISDIVDSGFVKKALDALTDLVDGADNIIDRINNPFVQRDATNAEYEKLKAEYDELAKKGDDLTDIEKYRLSVLEAQLEILKMQANAEETEAANKLQKQLTRHNTMTNMDADQEALVTMNAAFDAVKFTGDVASYQEALRGVAMAYQEYYDKVIQVRDAGVSLTENQEKFISDFEDLSITATTSSLTMGDLIEGYYQLIDAQGNVVAYTKDYSAELEEQSRAMSERQAAEQEWKDALEAVHSLTSETSDEEAEAAINRLIAAEAALDELDAQKFATEEVAEAAQEISFDEATESAARLTVELKNAATEAAKIKVGSLGIDTEASGTSNAPGGPTLVNELGPELIADKGRAFIANNGRPAVVNLSRGAVVVPANQTREALRGGMPTRSAAGGIGKDHLSTFGKQVAEVIEAVTNPLTVNLTGTGSGLQSFISKTQFEKGIDTLSGKGKGGSGGGGGGEPAAPVGPTIEEIAKQTKDLLSNLDKQAKLANNQGNYVLEAQLYEQAQEAIKKMVDDYRAAGYSDDSDEILDLLNKNFEYANKQLTLYQSKWDELIKALQADTDAQEMANKLAEKQQAVDDAREALANAQRQRTIRMYNAATGQWEWIADQKTVSGAQEKLTKAEESYADEVKSQAVKELQSLRNNVADLNNVVLGPALSAVALMAENSDEFQNFARALNAVYGVGTYLSSTEGSSKVISTADSHDVNYTFGNVTLTEDQASSMSVAELARKLSVLKIS